MAHSAPLLGLLLPFFVAQLVGCRPQTPDTGGGETRGETDSAVATDCVVTATGALVEAMPTFADVSWTAPEGATISVEARSEGLANRSYPIAGSGQAFVPFLDAGHDWTLQVRATVADGSCTSAAIALRTPPASSKLPALIPSMAPDAESVPMIATSLGGALGAAVVFNPAGDYQWWATIDPGTNFDRARASADGKGMWVMRRTGNQDDVPVLLHFPWIGEPDETIEIPEGHHDFVELHDQGDRLAWLVADHRNVNGEQVVGDALHVLGDNGVEREIWNAFDHFPVVETVGWTESVYPGERDWTHANTLVYVPEQDAFLVALHFIPAVVMIDRSTGEQKWVFGEGPGVESSVSFGDGAPGQMHSPSLTESGLLLFENGDTESRRSQVTEFAVDWTAMTASRSWSAAPSDDAYAYVLGDARRLPNGRTITTWGSLGVAEEFDASANPTWKMNLPMGATFGFLDLPTPPWTVIDDE